MNDGLILGIDGGGTTAVALAVDFSGKVSSRRYGSSINYYSLGMEVARANFAALLESLKQDLGGQKIESIFIGMSALSGEATPEEIQAFAGGIVDVRSIHMHSDAYIALSAAFDSLDGEKPGVIMIAGTGSMGMARNAHGNLRKVGGWGHILGDGGSAYRIALDALRMSLEYFDNGSPQTMLLDAALRQFNADEPKDLIDVFYKGKMPRHTIADFSRSVDICAVQGDPHAIEILKRAGHDLYAQARVLIEYAASDSIAIFGSVLRHCAFVQDSFKACVQENYPGVTVFSPPLSSEAGAVLCGFRRSGIPLTREVYKTILGGKI